MRRSTGGRTYNMVAPTVLPGRAFQEIIPDSQLLFSWRAQNRTLVSVDNTSTGTLTRASAGGLTNGRGHDTDSALTDVRLVGPAADNQPRWGVSSSGVPHLKLEGARTNFQPISNPTTGWQTSSALSTASVTTVAPDGTLVTLLTDNSTTAVEQMIQDVEVASTVAVMSWYTKWNGSTFGAIHRMLLGSTADRGQVVWEFGSTGAMAITSTGAGNVLSLPTHIGNNWWKTSLECTAISTGQDNQIEIDPAITAVGTTGGNMFVAHVQVEDVASTGLFASSHIPSVSAAVTRAAETLSFPYVTKPRPITAYVKFVERGTRLASGAVFHIGAANQATDPRLAIYSSTGGAYQVRYDDGATEPNAVATASPSLGDVVEIRGVLNGDGSVTIGQIINGGGEVTVNSTAAGTFGTAWAAQTLYIGSRGTGSIGFSDFRQVKVALGVKTMKHMQEAL